MSVGRVRLCSVESFSRKRSHDDWCCHVPNSTLGIEGLPDQVTGQGEKVRGRGRVGGEGKGALCAAEGVREGSTFGALTAAVMCLLAC